jgi:hypothetical protein
MVLDNRLTPASVMLLYVMLNYECRTNTCSLFTANKLACFLKRLGDESFRDLKFETGNNGVYSDQVRGILQSVNGKYLRGLEQPDVAVFQPLDLHCGDFIALSDYIQNTLTRQQQRNANTVNNLISYCQPGLLLLDMLATAAFIVENNPSMKEADIIQQIKLSYPGTQEIVGPRYVTSILFRHGMNANLN